MDRPRPWLPARTSSESATRLPVDFRILMRVQNRRVPPAVRRWSVWSTSLDVAVGVTTKSSAARLRAGLKLAPARGAGTILAPGRIELAVGDEPVVGPAAGQTRQSVLILLEHNGAVRRHVAIVCAGGSFRIGDGSISPEIWTRRHQRLDRAEFRLRVPRASRADAEQRVVPAGLTPVGPRRMLSHNF